MFHNPVLSPHSAEHIQHIIIPRLYEHFPALISQQCKDIKSGHEAQQAELRDVSDDSGRAAMSLFITASIATYRPDSAESAEMVDQLCLHTEAWLLWLQIFRTVCRGDSDIERLTTLSKAILKSAALAGNGYGDCEKSTWTEEHESNLLQVSRMVWNRESIHNSLSGYHCAEQRTRQLGRF